MVTEGGSGWPWLLETQFRCAVGSNRDLTSAIILVSRGLHEQGAGARGRARYQTQILQCGTGQAWQASEPLDKWPSLSLPPVFSLTRSLFTHYKDESTEGETRVSIHWFTLQMTTMAGLELHLGSPSRWVQWLVCTSFCLLFQPCEQRAGLEVEHHWVELVHMWCCHCRCWVNVLYNSTDPALFFCYTFSYYVYWLLQQESDGDFVFQGLSNTLSLLKISKTCKWWYFCSTSWKVKHSTLEVTAIVLMELSVTLAVWSAILPERP